MQERPDYQQGKNKHHEEHQERRDHKVENGRHCLAQLLFQLTADHSGYKGRQDTALVSDYGNKAEEHQGSYSAGRVCHGVGVGQGAIHQHQSQDQAEHRRAAEYAESGPAHDRRQESESSAG